MENNLKLIEPNESRVDYYIKLWEKGDAVSEPIGLFENKELADDDKYIDSNEARIFFKDIKEGEVLLDHAFSALSANDPVATQIAVLLLDKIYSTQLKAPFTVANLIHEEIKKGLLDAIKYEDDLDKVIDKIARIMKGENSALENYKTYIYSFATKFCSRVCPNKYPVFDGYVAYLLDYYVQESKDTKRFGKYSCFVKAYDKLKEKYKLEGFSYKDIDKFMWTYGKALNKFAEKWNNKHKEEWKGKKRSDQKNRLNFKADVSYFGAKK